MERGPPDLIKNTCVNQGVIMAKIKSWRGASRSSDQDPTNAILGVFKTLIDGSNRDRRSRSMMDRFIVTVDRFDRRLRNFLL